MRYKHTEEQIVKFSSKALLKIKELGLMPAPHVYELWYVYFSQEHPEVARNIDNLERKSKVIDFEVCTNFYNKYLNTEEEVKQVRTTGGQIQTAIKDVNSLVHDVAGFTSEYSENLEKAKVKLGDKKTKPQDIQTVISDVMSETESLLDKNKQLEEQLSKQAELMASLENDLDRVRQEALTDGLTNVSNRKAFDDKIAEMLVSAMEDPEASAFSLILMDIDHFKAFNDNYGHQVGDQVLRLVAKTLLDGVKGRDFVSRYGGEEFAILLPSTNQHSGFRLADELREAVSKKKIINRSTNEDMGRITLSGGITEFYPGDDADAMIQRADQALYEAKERGRNCINMARVKIARD